MSKFIDTIKHAIIEDDDPKAEGQAKPQTEAAPVVATPVATTPDTVIHATMNEETEHVYQRILAKASFEGTQVAATIHRYLDPLSAIPSLDERMRFKTAVI